MTNWKAYLLASAAVGCCAAAEPANAQLVYAGGATFPAPVYRQLFDCHSIQVDGNPAGPTWPTSFLAAYPISPKCGNAGGDSSGLQMQLLYAPVGSGAGKRALIAYDASSAATGLGVPSASNTVPFVSSFQPTYGYPNLQFIGSDDIWNETDAANYAASATKNIGGNVIQMPALAGAVVIAFNGKDGAGSPLNIANAVPAGATADKTTFGYPGNYSGLNLTRKAVCGIFTGHITAWNDPELTKATTTPFSALARSPSTTAPTAAARTSCSPTPSTVSARASAARSTPLTRSAPPRAFVPGSSASRITRTRPAPTCSSAPRTRSTGRMRPAPRPTAAASPSPRRPAPSSSAPTATAA
jgi:hypothetical protein